MKNYLVYIRIGNDRFKWFVYAKDSREAIEKTMREIKSEFEHFEKDICALMVKEIKE